jgi:hypothetical protein
MVLVFILVVVAAVCFAVLANVWKGLVVVARIGLAVGVVVAIASIVIILTIHDKLEPAFEETRYPTTHERLYAWPGLDKGDEYYQVRVDGKEYVLPSEQVTVEVGPYDGTYLVVSHSPAAPGRWFMPGWSEVWEYALLIPDG